MNEKRTFKLVSTFSAAALLTLTLGAPRAHAQEDEGPAGGGEAAEAPEGDAEAPAAPEGKAPKPALPRVGGEATEGGAQPQVSEIHSVNQGDTLWDLCSKYLNSPWYWPKIWSYNPQITNPHWIYPGNELRFYPSDENLPTNVEVSAAMTAPQQGEDLDIPESLDVEDLVRSVGNVTVGIGQQDSVYSAHMGFVTQQEHAVAGQIQSSQVESQLLMDFDRAYVKLKSAAKKGENYAVYRTMKQIEHPITGEPYGYAVEIIGGVTVIDTSPQVATVEIAQAYRPIERGDFVGPWPENVGTRVRPVPNEVDAQGYIIETVETAVSEIGEYHMVFIDRGRTHGVQIGNMFTVLLRGDGFTQESSGLPNEEVARLMVIDVADKTSTAMVVQTSREVAVGDKVEMRKAL